jgi:hypothetical protein
VNQVTKVRQGSDSDETAGFIVDHSTLSASNSSQLHTSCVVDLGAACHMCNRSEPFIEFHQLKQMMMDTSLQQLAKVWLQCS